MAKTKTYTTDVSHIYPVLYIDDHFYDLATSDQGIYLEDDETPPYTEEDRSIVFFHHLQDLINIANSANKTITQILFKVYFYSESSDNLDPSDRYPVVTIGEKEVSSVLTSIWGSVSTYVNPPQWAEWNITEGFNAWLATGVDNDSILKLFITPDEVSADELLRYYGRTPDDSVDYMRMEVTYEEIAGLTAFNLGASF
jgi:hypothetical protein